MRKAFSVLGALVLIVSLAACGSEGTGSTTTAAGGVTTTGAATATTGAATTTTVDASTPTVSTTIVTGGLEPIVVPTLPEEIPGYTELDPATGLHMTGTPQVIDIETYRLKVTGEVERELSLSYDDLRRLPKITGGPELVCPGFFVDKTSWSGAQLTSILEMAGVSPDVKWVTLKAADGYQISLTNDEAWDPENFLAYEWTGEPLPVLHGFPLRAVLPGVTGAKWVKWLTELAVG